MHKLIQDIKENISKVMIGKESVIDMVLAAFFAGGHVLLEDMPGTGKTVLSRTLAKSLDLKFERIQFTPDLLPSDVTGLSFFHQKEGDFIFREGPVFTNILLADEINRATPRTQSSLLECMEERQVTVDGKTRALAPPFFVIATENPIETMGCYPLPEAQLDRFMIKIRMGSMTADEERRMLDRMILDEPLRSITPVCGSAEVKKLQESCRQVFVHNDLRDYIVRLVQGTRKQGMGDMAGVSPRGTLMFVRAAQGYALVRGREFVTPEDIKSVAAAVLCHRMIAPMESERQKQGYIAGLLAQEPLPTEEWDR